MIFFLIGEFGSCPLCAIWASSSSKNVLIVSPISLTSCLNLSPHFPNTLLFVSFFFSADDFNSSPLNVCGGGVCSAPCGVDVVDFAVALSALPCWVWPCLTGCPGWAGFAACFAAFPCCGNFFGSFAGASSGPFAIADVLSLPTNLEAWTCAGCSFGNLNAPLTVIFFLVPSEAV